MGKNLDPKCKSCRRLGEKLYLKGEKCFTPKCLMVKRNYPPGQHGQKLQGARSTEYGNQMREKQKAKLIYGILEKQFALYIKKAMKKQGDSGENLLKMLEMRIDNVVYRLGLAKSRSFARQLVLHRHILINGKITNIPSFQVKIGNVISVKEKSKEVFSDVEKESQKNKQSSWLEFDQKLLQGKVLTAPSLEEVKQTINTSQIIEFYSR